MLFLLFCYKNHIALYLQYLCWRVLVGLSDSITLFFMVAGHTKFSPDRSFGLLKKEFRKTAVNTLSDIAAVVTRSASCNTAELVGREDGIPLIATYDWTSFFGGKMSKISGISISVSPTLKRGRSTAESLQILLPIVWQSLRRAAHGILLPLCYQM